MPGKIQNLPVSNLKFQTLTGEMPKQSTGTLKRADFQPRPKNHGTFARVSEEFVKSSNNLRSTKDLLVDNRAILANCKAVETAAHHFVDQGVDGNWFQGVSDKFHNSKLYKYYKKDLQPRLGIQPKVDDLKITPRPGGAPQDARLDIRFNPNEAEAKDIKPEGSMTGAEFSVKLGYLTSPNWLQRLGNWVARKTDWEWTQSWRILTRTERLQEVVKESTLAAKIASLGITPKERDDFFAKEDVKNNLTNPSSDFIAAGKTNAWIKTEVRNLRKIVDVAGGYSFTQSQLETLKKAEEIIKKDANILDQNQGLTKSELQDLTMMALISQTASARALANSPKSGGDINMVILSSPFLMSPDTCLRMAAKIESLASDAEQKGQSHEKILNGLDQLDKNSGFATGQLQPQIGKLFETLESQKRTPDEYRNLANMWRENGENKGALYRYQGFIPLIAVSNSEDILAALRFQLKKAGVPAGDIEHSAEAIYTGLTAGSSDAIISGLRIQMEENAEPVVKNWVDQQVDALKANNERAWNASQFNHSCDGDLGVLHQEQRPVQEALSPLELIQTNERALDRTIFESNELAPKLGTPDFKINDIDNRQLPKPGSQDLKLDPEVQNALKARNEETIKECKALKGSYKVLRSLYEPNGELHNKVLAIEGKLAKTLEGKLNKSDSAKAFDDIANDIRSLRNEVAKKSPELAKDHLDHLNSFVTTLDKKAGALKSLNDNLLKASQGLAVPSADFFENQVEPLRLAFIPWQERSSENGFRNLAMFPEKNDALSKAVQNRTSDILADLDAGSNAYEKFKLSLDAIRRDGEIAEKGSSIQNLITSTVKHLQTASLQSGDGYLPPDWVSNQGSTTSLAELSIKYQAHKNDAPKSGSLHKALNDAVQKARTDGTLKVLGLPVTDQIPKSVLEDNFLAKSDLIRGANTMNGVLLNDAVADAVKRHLDQVAGNEPAKRVEAFLDLLRNLSDSNNNSAKDVLRLANTLFPPGSGADSLGRALGLAERLLLGKELGQARAEIYKAHIDACLEVAAQKGALKLLLNSDKPFSNHGELIEKAAKNMPGLVKLGFDPEKFRLGEQVSTGDVFNDIENTMANFRRDMVISEFTNLAEAMKNPGQVYTDLTSDGVAEYLTPDLDSDKALDKQAAMKCLEFESLYRLADAIANLEDNPKKTLQTKLTLALDRIVTNATGDSLAINLDQDDFTTKIQSAFKPESSDSAGFTHVNGQMNLLEANKRKLGIDHQNFQTLADGANQRFYNSGGEADLGKLIDNKPRLDNARRYANAMLAADSFDRRTIEKHGNKTLTQEGQKLRAEKESPQLRQDLQAIQDQKDNLLKYYDSKKLEAHPEREKFERDVEKFQERLVSLDNPFLSFRRMQGGDYATDLNSGEYLDLQKLYPEIEGKEALKKTALQERLRLHETNWQSVGRLASEDKGEGLQRGLALATYLASIDSSKLSQDQIAEVEKEYQTLENQRKELIGKQAELRITNATRAAILEECIVRGMSPADLAKESNALEMISGRLEEWGWKKETYAGRDTQIAREIETAKSLETDQVVSQWEKEAGHLRGELENLQREHLEVIAKFTGTVAGLEKKLQAASQEGRENLERNANELRRTNEIRFLQANLEGLQDKCPPHSVFTVATAKSFDALKKLCEADPEKIKKLDLLLEKAVDEVEKDSTTDAVWAHAPKVFAKTLDQAYRVVFDLKPNETLPASVELLIAREKLDFESVTARYIDDLLAPSLNEIHTRRQGIRANQQQLAQFRACDLLGDGIEKNRRWVQESAGETKQTPENFASQLAGMNIREIPAALESYKLGQNLLKDQQISAYLNQVVVVAALIEKRAVGAAGYKLDQLEQLDRQIESGIVQLDNARPKSEYTLIRGNTVFSLRNKLDDNHSSLVKAFQKRGQEIKANLNSEKLADLDKGYEIGEQVENALLRIGRELRREGESENFSAGFIGGENKIIDDKTAPNVEIKQPLESENDPGAIQQLKQDAPQVQNLSNASDFSVPVLRNLLLELNKKFQFDKNELEQLTSILSSDRALEDYGVYLSEATPTSRDVFAGLIEAQNQKEKAFTQVQSNIKPFFPSQQSSQPNVSKTLQETLQSLGIQKVGALGDGNCFFNAIADQVGGGQQSVRDNLANQMQQLQTSTQRSGFLDESSVSDEAIQKTRTDARTGQGNSQEYWGQNFHAIVAAEAYNRPVVVVSPIQVQVIHPDGTVSEGDAQTLKQLKSENPIVLCYNGLNHWDSGKIQ